MSTHHKHSRDRERDRLHPSSSSFYNKDYHHHTVDPRFSKRRVEVSRGGSKHYPTVSTSYSTDRPYEDKKSHHHGHSSTSGSYHQPYSSSSSHHRQSYEKHSSATGGTHHNDHHHGHASSSLSRYKSYEGTGGSTSGYPPVVERVERVLRKPLRVDYRKPYEKLSTSSSSGIRRIPPPLSPPPLMKISTTASSRYRQAPPEDRHHHRPIHRTVERSPRTPVVSTKQTVKLVSEPKARKAVDVTEKLKGTKRSAISLQDHDRRPIKKIKEEKHNGEAVEKSISAGTNGTNVGSSKSKNESEQINSTVEIKEKKRIHKRSDDEDDAGNDGRNSKRPLLKLSCTYCNFRCVSFKDFSIHTRSFAHTKVMSTVIDENRAKVISLKHTVRDQQKEIEKSLDEQKTLADTTSYCRVCEIDLRSDPKEHEANEIHNEIKGLVDRKCELCNVDFRLWKVYLFHTVSLEHVKRVALKEMKDREGQEDAIAGSNMTKEDLGIDLLEQKHVIFCKACVRYFPIREDNYDESCLRHCMALNHIKFVEDYTSRMKYIAKRDAEEKTRAEAKRLARKESEKEAQKAATSTADGEEAKGESVPAVEDSQIKMEVDESEMKQTEEEIDEEVDTSKEEIKDADGDASVSQNPLEDSHEDVEEEEEAIEEAEVEPEDDEPDEDEIQLHADEDDEVDAPPREDE